MNLHIFTSIFIPAVMGVTSATETTSSNIAKSIWSCMSSSLLHAVNLTVSNNNMANTVKCWYANKYDACLSSELVPSASGIITFNKQVYGTCDGQSVTINRISCINDYMVAYLPKHNCQSKTEAAVSDLGDTDSDHLQRAYCRASAKAYDCILNSAVNYCGAEGRKTTDQITSVTKITAACSSFVITSTSKTVDAFFPDLDETTTPSVTKTTQSGVSKTDNVAKDPDSSSSAFIPNILILFFVIMCFLSL